MAKKEIGKDRKAFTAQLDRQQEIARQAEKEIYENISQVLSIARLRLAYINLDDREGAMATIGETGLLLGKVAEDLRKLARQLSSIYAT